MQNPDGTAAAATQCQQQVQAASLQRETTESIALLRKAVLRLTQHVIRDTSTAAPTSWLTKLGPEDDMEAYLEIFEQTAQRKNRPHRGTVPHRTGPAGEPRPTRGDRPTVPRPQTGDPGLLRTQPRSASSTLPRRSLPRFHGDLTSGGAVWTTIAHHDIRTAPGVKVRVHPYRIPEARREAIQAEVRQMLQLWVIEELRSAWSSPVVRWELPFLQRLPEAERGVRVRRLPHALGGRAN